VTDLRLPQQLKVVIDSSNTDVQIITQAASVIHGAAPQNTTNCPLSTLFLAMLTVATSAANAIVTNIAFQNATVRAVGDHTRRAMNSDKMAQMKENPTQNGWRVKMDCKGGSNISRTVNGSPSLFITSSGTE